MFLVYLNKNIYFELNPKSIQVNGKILTNLNKLCNKVSVVLHVEPVLYVSPKNVPDLLSWNTKENF